MAFIGVLSTQLLARAFGPDLAARLDQDTLAPEDLVWRRQHDDAVKRN